MENPTLQDRINSRLKLLGIPSQRLKQQENPDDAKQKAINLKKYEDYRTARLKRIDAGKFNHHKPTSEPRLIESPVFLPDSICVICQKTIEETAGRRIVAQQMRGILISNKPIGGGNRDHHYKSHKLSSYPLYLVVWGPGTMWSEESIQRATEAFHKGRRSWFCQLCGNRICPECGYPQNFPLGSQLLYDDGRSYYLAMLPISPGCINASCINHRRGDHER